MAITDVLSNLAQWSPGKEELLGAIPLLLGSYSSARGGRLGAPLQMLGGLLEANAFEGQGEYQAKKTLPGLLAQLNSIDPKTSPAVANLWNQRKGAFGQLTPEELKAETVRILGTMGYDAKINPLSTSTEVTIP